MEQVASTNFGKEASRLQTPYVQQDPHETASLARALEDAHKAGKKHGVRVNKTRFDVAGSKDGIRVDSWRFQDWDYKKRGLPTYARGLFTTERRDKTPEIAVRGYDKFFNVNEVSETKWETIAANTKGPYELSLKENGCIIFISGLEDDTLLVCSKHSTGDRSDVELSHASAGERRLEQQLQRFGKTKKDLARELRTRNVTAVAELCDDSFEEHILAYGPEKAGLYLHGINLNLPDFMTYPGALVQQFADQWGFVKTGMVVMDKIEQVKAFLEEVAETGAHDGRDVEGFVIRCKMSYDPKRLPYQDWFFKYKFEEPYLMYRQWRECTKSMISGKTPRYKKHQKITQEYLLYARKRLAEDPAMGKLYTHNHGIIRLRNDFLAFKQIKGSDAANLEALDSGGPGAEVTKDVILVPIATIGCGKTTLAVALAHLFGWGHIQNDNIRGPKRPPRFTKALLDELDQRPAVIADRNNAQKHERKQLITDVKLQRIRARLVALHFVHNDLATIRRVTQQRVCERGDNHQTIQAATDMNKVRGIMEGFIQRFEPCDVEREPDSGFDAVIDLEPTADSRVNLEAIITELHRLYPSFIPTVPSPEQMDKAIEVALKKAPELRHAVDGGAKDKNYNQRQPREPSKTEPKKKPLEYMSVELPTEKVLHAIEKTFTGVGPETSRFLKHLQGTRRVQSHFHVTLMHRASSKENPELWQRYVRYYEKEGSKSADGRLGELNVMLDRVVWDDRVMAIAVRLVPGEVDQGAQDKDDSCKWVCINRVAHVTVGTRDISVKPKESNDVLARWLDHEDGGAAAGIQELVIEGKPLISGVVKGVLSR